MAEENKNIPIEEPIKEFKVPENNIGNKKNLIYLFLITFVFGIIIVSVFLKGLTPNMDLEIGENPVAAMNQREDEDEDNIRAQIDQRLKMIQNEEDMPGVSERGYETGEDVVKKFRGEDYYNQENTDKETTNKTKNINEEEKKDEFVMETVAIPTHNAPSVNTVSKIYIGQYSDMQKAVEMQSNILDSGLNITPIIKEVNGYYTIQVGAFTNPESAKMVAETINNAGFSAKIVREVK